MTLLNFKPGKMDLLAQLSILIVFLINTINAAIVVDCKYQVTKQPTLPFNYQTTSTAGDKCAFPFTYRKQTYNECTDIDTAQEARWCYTVKDAIKGSKWGYCQACTQATGFGATCSFPFMYKGKKYYSCTEEDDEKPWCYIEENAVKGSSWLYCDACSDEVVEYPNIDTGHQGTADEYSASCIFPFRYKLAIYTQPTTKDSIFDAPWCYTVENAIAGSPWGYSYDGCLSFACGAAQPLVFIEIERSINFWFYNGAYEQNQKCSWKVVYGSDYGVMIRAKKFFLEYSEGCENDRLRVKAGGEKKDFCGRVLFKDIKLPDDNEVDIEFFSDGQKAGPGFLLDVSYLRPGFCPRKSLPVDDEDCEKDSDCKDGHKCCTFDLESRCMKIRDETKDAKTCNECYTKSVEAREDDKRCADSTDCYCSDVVLTGKEGTQTVELPTMEGGGFCTNKIISEKRTGNISIQINVLVIESSTTLYCTRSKTHLTIFEPNTEDKIASCTHASCERFCSEKYFKPTTVSFDTTEMMVSWFAESTENSFSFSFNYTITE